MKAFIADNPKGKHGVHPYTPEEYGIDPEAVRRDFRTTSNSSTSPPNEAVVQTSREER